MHDDWGMSHGWDMSFGWVFMMIFWVLALGALVWLVTWLILGQRGRVAPGPRGDSPLELLDRRLANGEIDVEEYEKVRQALTSKPK